MNVVLIGYRGTGKSEVGRRLADRLGMPLVRMDAAIVREAGLTIPEIVDKYGWQAFRDLESAQAARLANLDNLVIDTGGGVVERPQNIHLLRKNGRVFWLQASVATIVARIAGDDQRPSLTGNGSFLDEVAEVLERRTPLYRAAADQVLVTDDMTPDEVVDRIMAALTGAT